MGPFLAASVGETTEWFNSGVEMWRKRGGDAEDKEAEKNGGKKRNWYREGCRRQVLISNRLLVMRSLFRCSQIDVM